MYDTVCNLITVLHLQALQRSITILQLLVPLSTMLADDA